MFKLLCGVVGLLCVFLTQGNADCQCGHIIEDRVIRGHDVDRGDYPWLVALFKGENFTCSGTLVSNKHVVTAYHCVKDHKFDDIKLIIGGYDLDKTYPEAVISRVESIDYFEKNGSKKHDRYDNIAMLNLKEAVQFNKYIQPICIPKSNQNFVSAEATIIGWGDTIGNGTNSKVPNAGEIVITTTEFCNDVTRRNNQTHIDIDDRWCCAGLYDAEEGACSGDGGSPLMHYNNKKTLWEIVGIATANMGCTNTDNFGYYVNVTMYSKWIMEKSYGEACTA